MKIRHRITLLVVLAFVAIVLIGGYAVFQSRDNAGQVKSVTEGVVPSALATADLVSQLKDVRLGVMTVVTAPDASLATQSKEALEAQKTRLRETLAKQLQQADDERQRGLVQQAQESLNNYFTSIDEATQFKLSGQKEMAEAVFFAEVSMYQKEMEVIVETLRIEKNRVKDGAISTLNQSLSGTVTAIAIVTVLMMALLGGLGALLYRQITGPISRMQEMMSDIATHQDFTRRVPVDREDEIGRSIVAFNSMIARIEENSALLKQKTTDMQAMLQNMPQGILTLTEGDKVHPEYSAYLETILETRDIAGRDLMDLVFSGSNLGADTLSQLAALGGACIGEDVMNFEFNQHLMIGEFEKTLPDGRVKVLDLNWSPIIDEHGTTVRLMLCVRDVTELRQLAAEANEQRRALEIIGEILAVNQERFHEFIISAIKFIDKNELVIREHVEADAEAIALLFRNMHTIKGNARTYGLQHLTNVVHEAEQTYEALRKPHPDLAWDQTLLLDELASVKKIVERYAYINEISLGRKGPGRRGPVERYLMVDKDHIQETLHRLETVNTGNLHELVAARDAVRKTLRLLGTEPIASTLAGVLESLPGLAQELGKAAPLVRIEDKGYRVRNQAAGLLKNVFMHLIRNSVDHGLEDPQTRTAQGKPEAGTLSLELDEHDHLLHITLSDDGRGLALGRIRKIGIEKGLIAADEPLSDEETAALIFRAGFSTADKVTEVSGRGVGMDAVQDFIKREHGRIDIVFVDKAVGADFRQFKTVVCLPEDFAVQAEGHDLARPQSPPIAPVPGGMAASPDALADRTDSSSAESPDSLTEAA